MTKAFTTNIIQARANYENRDVQVSTTSGRGGISVTVRNADEHAGVYVNLTPDQAREFAADLLERADEIDADPRWRDMIAEHHQAE